MLWFFPVVMYRCESWTIKKAESQWIVVLQKTLGSPLDCKEIKPVNSKGNLSWIFIGRTDVEAETCCEEQTHWKRTWCWARLKTGEGDDRGWEGWMASPARWTWVWAGSRSWWCTGKPGVLQSMGLQRAGCDWPELRVLEDSLGQSNQKDGWVHSRSEVKRF